MRIVLNNIPEEIDVHGESLTVNELLKYKNYTFRLLVIKVNGQLVKRDQYDSAVIRDGDDVVVMHLVSGG